jgi:endonuclease/exonuclease/phosphatase (EEP) superfamily protein YafD
MIVRSLLIAALVLGAAISLLGLLAPFHPQADFLNHFRPYLFAGTGALLAATLALRDRRLTLPSAALVALNAVLLLLPLLWSAQPVARSAVGQALASGGGRDLKIVTFNMAFGDAGAAARFLLQEDPDIVLLQEVGVRHAAALRGLLARRYPHGQSCAHLHRCAAAIFAKRGWVATGREGSSEDGPDTIWAQFDDPELGRFRVIGVHLTLPYRAERQTRQVDWLIALRGRLTGPTILAGDFNMTPWAYRLQRLLATGGLRRHATFLRSWPTDRHPQFRLPAPAFLIDHVVTTPDIRSVSIRTGPNLGSDHLPVVAQLRLPAA